MRYQKGDAIITVMIALTVAAIIFVCVMVYKDLKYMKENNCQPTGKEKLVNELKPIFNGKTTSYVNGVSVKYEYLCSNTGEYLWR